jgi:hypothetical protein
LLPKTSNKDGSSVRDDGLWDTVIAHYVWEV